MEDDNIEDVLASGGNADGLVNEFEFEVDAAFAVERSEPTFESFEAAVS